MVTKTEANKIVDTVLDYFHISTNRMTLEESIHLYNQVYHSVGLK